jgi:glycosyltransferase involved in cell wall biosynthesis
MSSTAIRIVFLVSTLRRTGPTNQLYNIIQHLDRARFEPIVVTLSPEPASSMRQAFVQLPVEVHSLSLGRLQGALRGRWRHAMEEIAGPFHTPVVVHSQGLRADRISAAHLTDLPRVATVRNYPYHDYVMKFGRLAGTIMSVAHIRALRALPVVVSCSASLTAPLRRHGVETRVIRNGVDTRAFRPADAAQRAMLRARLALPAGRPVAVSVGALSPRKDPLAVIQATRALHDPAITMVFVGGGELEDACRKAAAGDERIRLIGHVDEVMPWLQAADFFVSAAHSEGLPNSVLEAMATGLPVVLSDIEPHVELLRIAPSAGELFATGNPAALAEALARAAQRGVAGRVPMAGVAEEISAARMSQRYQDLYAALAGVPGA